MLTLVVNLLKQGFVLLSSQDPVLQEVLIVAVPPGSQAQLVPMHSPRMGVHPSRAHPLLTLPAEAYFGNHLTRQLAYVGMSCQ